MLTVIETPTFQRTASAFWDEDEIDENYPALRDAVDDFMAMVKQKALEDLEN